MMRMATWYGVIAAILPALAACTPAGQNVQSENPVKAHVKRDASKVWLEGAANFQNSDTGLSHIRTIACHLRHRGHKVDFDWLMGVSGEAFCFYYHPDGTFLSSMMHSYDVANAALGPYGYEGRWERAGAGNDVQVILQSLGQQLAEGCPIIAPGALPSENMVNSECDRWFLICGVDRRAETIMLLGAGPEPVTTKLAKGDHPKPEGPHPCWYGMIRHVEPGRSDCIYGPNRPILVVERAAEPVDRRTAALAGLRQAVLRAKETRAVARRGWGAGTYLAGHAALSRLHHDLLAAKGDGLEEFRRLNPPKGDPFGGLDDELRFLELLSKRRQSAAGFLAQAAPLLAKAAQPHLAAAAKHFQGSAAEAINAFRIRYGSEEALARVEAKSDNDSPQWRAYWKRADEALASRDNRKAMGGHLARVIEHEKAAIAEIEQALAGVSQAAAGGAD